MQLIPKHGTGPLQMVSCAMVAMEMPPGDSGAFRETDTARSHVGDCGYVARQRPRMTG
jgi:hypothetical protein